MWGHVPQQHFHVVIHMGAYALDGILFITHRQH